MNDRVHAILAPASIAIVGASDDPTRIGGRPVRILQARGYAGDIFPVNPKYDRVQGLPCYPDIASLPSGVDLYIIILPAAAAVTAVEQAAEHGARAVVLFSGGFAEVGPQGKALQDQLSAIVARYGLALLGPNALGAASFVHRAFPTFATALETLPDIDPGRVALVSQSGGFAFNLFTESYWAGARFSHVISTGNEAGLTFADYLDYLADDPATDAIIGYLEGVSDGERFRASLAHLQRAGKPLFVIKSGASERGSTSVASHTAQLSGNDSAFSATFLRYGVTRLTTLDEAVDVARAWSAHAATSGITVATNSGGTAVYLADACERYGVELAPLTAKTRDLLQQALPVFAGLANPIDITAQIINDRSLLGTTLAILDRDETVTAQLLFLGSMEYLADEFVDRLLDIRESLTKPLFVSWAGVGDRTRAQAAERGLPICADPARVLRGLGLVRSAIETLRSAPASDAITAPPIALVPLPDTLTPRPVAGDRLALDEWQTMALLERFEVHGPRRRLVRSTDEALSAAEVGYPCVLKLIEPLLPHRALAGAVVTGISSETELRAAYERLRREHRAEVCLVAETVPPGYELIAGVLADPTFGSRAALGPGGVWVNDAEDVQTLVPPYDDAYVAQVLSRLNLVNRIHSSGFEPDRLAADVAAILRALAGVVAAGHGWITEIECNPIVITPTGVAMLDALAFVNAERQP
jgi:acetyltransferase